MVRGYKIKTFNITKKELPARQWKAKAFNNFHPSEIFYVYTKEGLDELMSSLLEDCADWGYNIFDRVKNEYIAGGAINASNINKIKKMEG